MNNFDLLLKDSLEKLISECHSVNELRELKSRISQYVGDVISDHIVKLHEQEQEKSFLWRMSDDEFKSYLKNKYDKNYDGTPNVLWAMNTSLTAEEFERYTPITKKVTEEILKKLDETRKYRNPPYQRRKWF